MRRIPRISETEWQIMKLVWVQSPISANQIIEALSKKDPTWHPSTAKTLLNRLVKKGALGFTKEHRAYLYRPLVKESDCVAAVSESFLKRVFGGSLKPMLAHFVDRKKLSPADINELKRILDSKQR